MNTPNFAGITPAMIQKADYAATQYDRLMKAIADFEGDLSPNEEVGACLASFGRDVRIRVESLGFRNPYLIIFQGTIVDSGERVELVQHVSQINLLLLAVPKPDDHVEAKRIGFHKDDSTQGAD